MTLVILDEQRWHYCVAALKWGVPFSLRAVQRSHQPSQLALGLPVSQWKEACVSRFQFSMFYWLMFMWLFRIVAWVGLSDMWKSFGGCFFFFSDILRISVPKTVWSSKLFTSVYLLLYSSSLHLTSLVMLQLHCAGTEAAEQKEEGEGWGRNQTSKEWNVP